MPTIYEDNPKEPILDSSNTNARLWAPSMGVDEDVATDGTDFTTHSVSKVSGANRVRVQLDGHFLLKAVVDNVRDSGRLLGVRFPSLYIDMYVAPTPPDVDVDGYVQRSTPVAPAAAFMHYFDSYSGYYMRSSQSCRHFPASYALEDPLIVPVSETITITDAGVTALFDGASGTVDVNFKPRMSAAEYFDPETGEWSSTPPNECDVVITAQFIGSVKIDPGVNS